MARCPDMVCLPRARPDYASAEQVLALSKPAAKVADMSATSDASDAGSAEPTYEQARDELVNIVAQLEAGGTTLEQSLALWQRGEDLASLCERYLDAARTRLDAATGTNAGPSS
jgi:exodeoxyribonuclease VII small subunit